ncbi:MAG: pilin [archaeon]
MKNIKNNFPKHFIIAFVLFAFIYFLPSITKAADDSVLGYGWVQCDGVRDPSESGRQVECNFENLVSMAGYLINWLFMISIPVIIGLIAYSGFLHMTAKEENIKKSYKILKNAVIGLIVMLMAWFIVTTILNWILEPWAADVAGTLVDKQITK